MNDLNLKNILELVVEYTFTIFMKSGQYKYVGIRNETFVTVCFLDVHKVLYYILFKMFKIITDY